MHKDNNHDHNHQNHESHDHHHHDHSHHHHHGDFKKLFLTSLPIGFTLSRAIGAILMSLSTVIVALNAMQLRLPKK